jgi:hypothetical protein
VPKQDGEPGAGQGGSTRKCVNSCHRNSVTGDQKNRLPILTS